jgi:hypothetical protein
MWPLLQVTEKPEYHKQLNKNAESFPFCQRVLRMCVCALYIKYTWSIKYTQHEAVWSNVNTSITFAYGRMLSHKCDSWSLLCVRSVTHDPCFVPQVWLMILALCHKCDSWSLLCATSVTHDPCFVSQVWLMILALCDKCDSWSLLCSPQEYLVYNMMYVLMLILKPPYATMFLCSILLCTTYYMFRPRSVAIFR